MRLLVFFRFLDSNEEARTLYKQMELPPLDEDILKACMADIPIEEDTSKIVSSILSRYEVLTEYHDRN